MSAISQMKSWVKNTDNSDFSIYNIPFGVYYHVQEGPRVCSAIGPYIVDMVALYDMGILVNEGLERRHLANRYLNDFIELGKPITNKIRLDIQSLLESSDPAGLSKESYSFLVLQSEVEMLMPVQVGDYTDFYSSREHATNVGTMFRDPDNALLPNWLHIPIGYHGRSSSLVVSGTPIHRPKGQLLPQGETQPVFGPSRLLDFELEMGFVIGRSNALGQSISTKDADKHIFGMILFNDWSARDIQKWEYVPLGPFLGKSFASTVSPWIITMEAMEPFKVPGPVQDPQVLDYLQYEGDHNYDIDLFVDIVTPEKVSKTVCHSNFKYMYWNMIQQLAHHTVNGCNMRVGDMCASGTISGPTPDSYGSMLEISWKGTKPVQMPDGTERKFILDGDTVVMRGYAEKEGVRVGFGEATGQILPSL